MKIIPYRRKIKLTIILLENTLAVKQYEETINRIVKYSITGGKFIIINYGSSIAMSEMKEDNDYNEKMLFTEPCDYHACMYDVFNVLNIIVMATRYCSDTYKSNSAIISEINIIGIGRCIDNCFKTKLIDATNTFQGIIKLPEVSTKYYCIEEKYFVNAATMGFRFIGNI